MDETEIEKLWIEEAESRRQTIRNGKVIVRSADEVMHDAISKLK